MEKYKVGTHVQVCGTVKYTQYPYIWVLRKDDIKICSTTIRTLREVLKGQQHPKRIKDEDEDEEDLLRVILLIQL